MVRVRDGVARARAPARAAGPARGRRDAGRRLPRVVRPGLRRRRRVLRRLRLPADRAARPGPPTAGRWRWAGGGAACSCGCCRAPSSSCDHRRRRDAAAARGRWPQTLREVVAAAVFLENWQLAADAVDYAARSNMSSPVQHFWSLSIQGQFFLVWPLLVALVALAARGDAARVRAHLTVATLGRVRRLADVLRGADRDEPAAGLLPLADPPVGVRSRRPARADDRHGPAAAPRRGSTWAGSGSPGCWPAAPCCGWARCSPGSRRCGPPRVRCWCCWPAPRAPVAARTGC